MATNNDDGEKKEEVKEEDAIPSYLVGILDKDTKDAIRAAQFTK